MKNRQTYIRNKNHNEHFHDYQFGGSDTDRMQFPPYIYSLMKDRQGYSVLRFCVCAGV